VGDTSDRDGRLVTEQTVRPTSSPAPSRPVLPLAMLKACRPKQWAKNVLVFVAPAAAGVLGEPYYLRLTVQGFVAFCLVSSATYLLNDILDVESDRRHPTKRNRPIASGAVPVPLAVAMAVVLFVGGIAVAVATSWPLVGVVAGYAVLTTAYSMYLKRMAVMDLVILSAGFILRLLGGALAAGVDVSEWFLLVSLFGSLFIAAAKRFAEKKELGEEAAALRPTLGQYSVEYLGLVRTAAAAAVMMSYCQWAVESGDSQRYATPWVQLSIIPFVIAILRYALLVDQGKGSAPEEVLAEDRQMQLMGVLLVACLFLAIYL
jgi:decaprenyl-phosphate phosphoribosyltransferase